MSISRRLSNASATFRHEWRPSRWLVMALALLGVLGACSVLASGLPRGAAWLVAITALLDGARAARREGMRRCVRVTWGADGGLFVGAEPVQVPRVQ